MLASLFSIGVAVSGAVYAATSSTTFTVNATVQSNCTISATNVDFGIYDPNAGSPSDTSSTLSVLCTNGTPYTVALDAGSNAGSTVANRHMVSENGDQLTYDLYTDASHTSLWGDGNSGTDTVSASGSGGSQAITVYAEIPNGQTVPAGSYSDSVTATLNY
ncbi:spore coat protein U domain-containing protein [Oleiagrimonas sp. C23AA]|nr:spore coat protein U domain-containing protein [Oleiagrimonas sp. C23AA]